MQYKNIVIEKIFHAGIKIKKDITIYVDPLNIPDNSEPADYILITHEHLDHCSPEDVEKITTSDTHIITIPTCLEKILNLKHKKLRTVKPGEVLVYPNLKITATPAYNINKFRSPGVPFHPQADNKVGFVIDIAGCKIYHAGDTDNIPEIKKLPNLDIAFLPVSGIFTMTPEEAAQAAEIIQADLTIPMHYGDFSFQEKLVGEKENGELFKKLTTVPVKII